MVGDRETSNMSIDRVHNYTHDSESREPEVVSDSVRRLIMQPIPQEKRMMQPILQPIAKIKRSIVNTLCRV